MSEWILIALVMITEAFLHYFPWMKLLKGKTLPRLLAYIFGVLGLMVPFTVWLLEHSNVNVAVTLWKVIVAGGVMVTALYGLDHYLELQWKDMEAMERENSAKK